ncbi:MAG: hypothetical protein C0176_02390 [Mesoaciditoga sp.]|uniref:hypothetical protein n=1 Tax=Athalassotoga sp. TaxID=2022597 RepID=UPI000CC716C1|nr:MAG: hypothetical protein C0185_00990 [Mesoaciditoga sp.]PMP80282.1 MAG: hypothetical protein C0176_02390 [Mesoaciditoga sp.]HEU23624.1 hypothetical protein [Mesoaciditoga lauensis]
MRSKEMAFGSIYSAISLILIVISFFFSNDLFFLMAASLPLIMLVDQFGKKTAVFSYAVISTVAFLIFPLQISSMAFIIIFGPFAILRSFFTGRKAFIINFIMLVGLSLIFYFLMMNLIKINLKYTLPYMLFSILMLLIYELFCEYFSRWYRNLKKRF